MLDKTQKLEGILKDSIKKNGFISCFYTTSEETTLINMLMDLNNMFIHYHA